jgi:hypothetical protein
MDMVLEAGKAKVSALRARKCFWERAVRKVPENLSTLAGQNSNCHYAINHFILRFMAGTTGLEPATSAVTGQRSNQLSYVPFLNFSSPPAYFPGSMGSVKIPWYWLLHHRTSVHVCD